MCKLSEVTKMAIDPKMLEEAKKQAQADDKKDREDSKKAREIWDGVVGKDGKKA
jgi:hypothetical protein